MKFFHISDLHIGKRVCGFSMLEDQRYILKQIAELAEKERPDGIFVVGDLYDRSMPSAEAVELADDFFYECSRLKVPVWIISGNHDCAERVAYGGRMMEQAGIYVSRVFDGTLQKYTAAKCAEDVGCDSLKDVSEKSADIYMLPYIRPAQVRRFYPDEEIETTQQAVEAVLKHTTLDKSHINILLMHQFLAGASVCESEEISIGGSDQIDASVVSEFDYVALGHLHGPQKVGRETVRYCGSPLKYSFSEVNHRKSVTVVEIQGKYERDQICEGGLSEDEIRISTIPLRPLHDMREIRGPIEQILNPEVYELADREDYLHITLTDEKEILDAIGKLRDIYPNIMRLDFESGRGMDVQGEEELLLEEKSPEQLFEEFFLKQNGFDLNEQQRQVVHSFWENR